MAATVSRIGRFSTRKKAEGVSILRPGNQPSARLRCLRGAGAARTDASGRRRLRRLCAGDRPSLGGEAALEGAIHLFLDGFRFLVRHFRDFRNDQELRAIEHALLSERQVLRARQEGEALQYIDHVVDRSGPHAIRIVLEAALPVLVVVDLAVPEQPEEPLDFFVADRAAEADAIDVVHGNEHCGLVRHHPEMVETARGTEDGFGFYSLNNSESMVWVNDLVTNLECHMSPTAAAGKSERCANPKQSLQYTEGTLRGQGNRPKIGSFFIGRAQTI